jgi:choline dehydrogenase
MIGEKVADMVLGRQPLAASNAPSYMAGNWRSAQR